MKCPKCGSETRLYHGYVGCSNMNCDAKRGFTEEEQIKQAKYQARLHKVLSKFDRDEYGELHKEEVFYLFYLTKNGMTIQYQTWNGSPKEYCEDINKPFTLCGDMGRNNKDYVEISLDTVESILKDLGE